jgi:diacylglycerol O-acyltransferase / wax synthase
MRATERLRQRLPRLPSTMSSRAVVDRATANDVLQLHFGTRPAETQVGALLVLASDAPLGLAELRETVADRIRAVPRLRQRLHTTPPGCGRPIWVDDPDFDISRHVTETPCPAPADEAALLDLVAAAVTAPLPDGRPPWAMTLVHGLPDRRSGLVLTFHHVLADGIGGLAVLASLVDGAAEPPGRDFPRPSPTPAQLALDAARLRARAVRRLPAGTRRMVSALIQVRQVLLARAPSCSLNRPTGPRRSLAVVRADLDAVRDRAHAHGGTVNDVVLTAVAGALHDHLAASGEQLHDVVASVPVSGHAAGDTERVRNQAGVVPVRVPAGGDAVRRLEETAERTRVVRSTARGATAMLLEPLFAALARLGVVGWFTAHQRRVNTFVTNLRGPDERLTLLGAHIVDVIPIGAISGNVAVAFGVLSYAGELTVTVVVDPDVCPDVAGLATRLQRQLDVLTSPVRPTPVPDGPGAGGASGPP